MISAHACVAALREKNMSEFIRLLEVTAFRTKNTCLTPFIPLLNSRIDIIPARIAAPGLNRPLFQFIVAVDVCLVKTPLHGCLYLTVNWIEI